MSAATVIIGALKIMLDSRTTEAEAVTALNVLRKRGLAWHEVFAVIQAEPRSTGRAPAREAPRSSYGRQDFRQAASRFDDVASEFQNAANAFAESFSFDDWINLASRASKKTEKAKHDFTSWPYSFRMPFGKFIGETLGAIMLKDASYIRWLLEKTWIEKRWPELYAAVSEIDRRAKGKP